MDRKITVSILHAAAEKRFELAAVRRMQMPRWRWKLRQQLLGVARQAREEVLLYAAQLEQIAEAERLQEATSAAAARKLNAATLDESAIDGQRRAAAEGRQ